MPLPPSLLALKKPEKQQLGTVTNRGMLLVNKDRKRPSGVVLPVGRQILSPVSTIHPVVNLEIRREFYNV